MIGWNIDCSKHSTIRTEPLSHFDHQSNEFLNKILDRILQELPDNNKDRFSIRLVIDCRMSKFAHIDIYKNKEEKDVFIGDMYLTQNLILSATNEAEIAFAIAHEIGHVVAPYFLPSDWRYKKYERSIFMLNHCVKEKETNYTAIKLMAKAGYDVSASIIVLQRTLEQAKKRDKATLRKAIDDYNNALKDARENFSQDQKKWILFSPEDLEKVKEFLRNK